MKQLIKYLYILFLRRRFGSLGKGSYFSPFGTYLYRKKIHVADHVYVGPRAIISVSEGIKFGRGVTVGPELIVMGGDHNFRKVGCFIRQSTTGGVNKRVVIEDDVWIGARVTILKGVTIGEGAVVGAGSVVTKDVVPYTLCAGNPARKIKIRFTRDELRQHIELVNSRYRFEELEKPVLGLGNDFRSTNTPYSHDRSEP